MVFENIYNLFYAFFYISITLLFLKNKNLFYALKNKKNMVFSNYIFVVILYYFTRFVRFTEMKPRILNYFYFYKKFKTK